MPVDFKSYQIKSGRSEILVTAQFPKQQNEDVQKEFHKRLREMYFAACERTTEEDAE